MLRFLSYDIVFQEIPNEITLAVNISNCPNRCKGCHSPHLMEDYGEILDENTLAGLLERYRNAITCFCFMGGDASPLEVECLAVFLRKNYGVKIA
ncbi:MAG: 4Fe-4S cluster-binding domain-containing protein, partial [Prevotellaceae bacterium]|nr:4Fe-4S cluster-binding domain-containing protein [Prevotellaceae bacterium]